MSEAGSQITAGRTAAMCSLAVLAAILLAGCGTPAVVKPSSTPLSGFAHDIQAAQNAVSQSERDAQSDASANPTAP